MWRPFACNVDLLLNLFHRSEYKGEQNGCNIHHLVLCMQNTVRRRLFGSRSVAKRIPTSLARIDICSVILLLLTTNKNGYRGTRSRSVLFLTCLCAVHVCFTSQNTCFSYFDKQIFRTWDSSSTTCILKGRATETGGQGSNWFLCKECLCKVSPRSPADRFQITCFHRSTSTSLFITWRREKGKTELIYVSRSFWLEIKRESGLPVLTIYRHE